MWQACVAGASAPSPGAVALSLGSGRRPAGSASVAARAMGLVQCTWPGVWPPCSRSRLPSPCSAEKLPQLLCDLKVEVRGLAAPDLCHSITAVPPPPSPYLWGKKEQFQSPCRGGGRTGRVGWCVPDPPPQGGRDSVKWPGC